MDKIDLQKKTNALNGRVEIYWLENRNIGLVKTQFHRITIRLEPFDSGLDYETQPTATDIVLDWYELKLENPMELDELDLSHKNYPSAEGSVYLGSAHNWCDVKELKFRKLDKINYEVVGSTIIEFENKGVAENESFCFTTIVEITTI